MRFEHPGQGSVKSLRKYRHALRSGNFEEREKVLVTVRTLACLPSIPPAAMNSASVSTSMEISTEIDLSLALAVVGYVIDVVLYVHE